MRHSAFWRMEFHYRTRFLHLLLYNKHNAAIFPCEAHNFVEVVQQTNVYVIFLCEFSAVKCLKNMITPDAFNGPILLLYIV